MVSNELSILHCFYDPVEAMDIPKDPANLILDLPSVVMAKLVKNYLDHKSRKNLGATCKRMLLETKHITLKNSVMTYDFIKYERGTFSRFLKFIKANAVKSIRLRRFKYVDDYQIHKLKKTINKQIWCLLMDKYEEEVMHMALLFKNIRIHALYFENCVKNLWEDGVLDRHLSKKIKIKMPITTFGLLRTEHLKFVRCAWKVERSLSFLVPPFEQVVTTDDEF
jgi:hypothetical protein